MNAQDLARYTQDERLGRLIASGSRKFTVKHGVLVHAVPYWFDIWQQNPEMTNYDYADYFLVINNSAVEIDVRMGSETYPVLAFSMQPITGKASRYYALLNVDAAVDTTANQVIVEYQRLPLDVQKVVAIK